MGRVPALCAKAANVDPCTERKRVCEDSPNPNEPSDARNAAQEGNNLNAESRVRQHGDLLRR